MRRSRRRLSRRPMPNIKNTKPTCAAVSMRAVSVTSENGGVNGPTTMPAARKPTTTDKPMRWHIQPTTPATTRMIAKS